jgi:ATP-dependent Clp protease ATP-binding subunit ClpC
MFRNKFSKNAIKAINIANKTSVKLGSDTLTVEHLFIGIISVKEGVGSMVLSKLGLDPLGTIKNIESELLGENNFTQIDETKFSNDASIINIKVSDQIKKVFEKAFELAISSGHNYIGTEHLLLGMLEVKDNHFISELSKLGIDFEKIRKEIESFVQYPQDGQQRMPQAPQNLPNQNFHDVIRPNDSRSATFFDAFGRNLTNEAREGKLDPIIGRDKEIDRVMQVLSRKTKNNPMLIGDAGVGKTAIVEGLAQRIAEGTISPVLSNYEIWSIDTASIVAGSQLRGDIEQKILDMIHDIEERGNVILFIDEIHTIMGAGSTSNSSLDIGNILKPALARGALHCIGATTIGEYRKHFDEDPALQRRFQAIDVDELSEENTYLALKRLKPVYETFHNVKITDGAIKASIKLSKRYITDRFLPDKAIDVIDEACAKNKLQRVKISPEFKEELEKLRLIVEKKNSALDEKKMEEASNFLDEEKKIMKNLTQMEKNMKRQWNLGPKTITEKEIKDIIHGWTKIPMNSMEENSMELVRKLALDLESNVIGQDYACQSVANSIKRAKAGLSGIERPLASFLFVGPTGVGKTELAKQLAKSLFGSKEALVQIDMSELMEQHSVSKLIGSPPGYVGYDQGGQLTDKVRRNPFSVILFDEIEKASPEVLNILLQIMDEGHLTDSKGKKVNFKNTIVIMTSNIGSDLLRKDTNVGLYLGSVSGDEANVVDQKVVETQEKILEELKNYLQPEFLNRIDDVIVFRELAKEDIAKIAKLNIEQFVKRLKKDSNIVLKNADSKNIVEYIVETGYSPEYGARELRRIIKSSLENAVADKILELNWDSESKTLLNLDVSLSKDNNFIIGEIEKVAA